MIVESGIFQTQREQILVPCSTWGVAMIKQLAGRAQSQESVRSRDP